MIRKMYARGGGYIAHCVKGVVGQGYELRINARAQITGGSDGEIRCGAGES